jgi:hypothetical protein
VNHPNAETYTSRADYFRACSSYWHHVAAEWDQRAAAISYAPDIKAWMQGRADHFRDWAQQDAEQAVHADDSERNKARGLLRRVLGVFA